MIPSNSSSKGHLWVDKYKPTNLSQIIGSRTEKSNPRKLLKWLQDWNKNHKNSKKQQATFKMREEGTAFKAALLSGPPGIGKTTTAHVVCKELNFDVIEFNASDTRSQKLLKEQVEEILSTRSIANTNREKSALNLKNKVIIMDEVDGMAGNEDRGGVAQLIQLIKLTKIPIICICNDRQHPKIRSLANYCYDLRFYKINLEPIRSAMMSMCFKEQISINPKALDQIIIASNHDIRQTIHNLSMWTSAEKKISQEQAEKGSSKAKKILKLGPWDIFRKLFSSTENQSLSLYDKNDLFFQDYDLCPLFVQQNYLSVKPERANGNLYKTLEYIAQTADCISKGDLVNKQIRSNSQWSLLPLMGIFSTIVPCHYMSGRISQTINFPLWFGKNSKRMKFYRILKELQCHTHLKISANMESFNLEYAQPLRERIFHPLMKEKMDGIKPCLNFMNEYHLLRSDLDNLFEVSSYNTDYWARIDSKIKAALTREFNKSNMLIPFSISSDLRKKKRGHEEFNDVEEIEEESEEDEETKLKLDPMIKEKKRKIPPTAPKEASAPKKRKVQNKKK